MDHTINDLVNQALELFATMTGLEKVSRGKDTYTWRCKVKEYSSWELARDFEELNRSRTLDPSGLTTFMMLRGLTEFFLKQIKFSAYDIILSRKQVGAQVKLMESLRDVLENPLVVDLIQGYQDDLRKAADHYGVTGKKLDELEKLLNDKVLLAYVRRDALRSVEDNLEAHQFVQGKADPLPPKFNPDVYEFWNINSLLAAMRSQKFSGISLVLIRDPEEALASFFCFAIRNGTTLTILTDRQEVPHPLYHRMARRPDRNLEKRAARNRFPYDLLDVRVDEESGKIFANARTSLVPINIEAVPLRPIRDLSADEFVWVTLMFDLIREKFWKQDHKLPELSYTGEMIVNPHALVGASGALVIDGHYTPLELPELKREDVTAEATASQWGRKVTGFNSWLVERYAHKVPETLLNLVGDPAKQLVEAHAGDEGFLPVVNNKETVWGSDTVIGRKGREVIVGKRGVGHNLVPVPLDVETFKPISFGPKKDIEKDRLWYARLNQMKAIQRLADDEFEREKDNVEKWVSDRVKARRDFLIDATVRGELISTFVSFEDHRNPFPHVHRRREEQRNILELDTGRRFNESRSLYGLSPRFCVGEYSGRRNMYECAINHKPASIFGFFRPSCPQALADLFGLSVEEMPWPLQHWYESEPYSGNHILDRIDPEDWELRDPWRKHLRLTFGVCLSKSGFAVRRKELGLPRKEWPEQSKTED